ncbi:MAG: RNA polymerase sigma factor [Acidimicrobiales bacterium]|nr:RNA polymerase sigma factor [Acidimicrobiales bacterium]
MKLIVRSEGPPHAVDQRREQLAKLFDQHYDAVYRYALARSGSEVLADEISGETFAEAARWYAQESPEPVSIGWLLTVARRRLVDHWRTTDRNRRRVEKYAISAELGRPEIDPESDDTVFEALRSLSSRQRAALTLRYLDDYSVHEVAEALECSYQAAESLLARARRSFAEAWKGIA